MSETPSNKSDKPQSANADIEDIHDEKTEQLSLEPGLKSDGESESDEALEQESSETRTSEVTPTPRNSSSDTSGNRTLYFVCAALFLLMLAGFTGVFVELQQLGPDDDQHQEVLKLRGEVQNLQSELQNNQSEVDAELQALEEASQKFETQQSTLENNLNSKIAQVRDNTRLLTNESRQQVDMLQKRVDGHQQRILSLSTTSREDWLLAEAEYLLKLANQRVMLENTTENAVAMLESADEIIARVSAGTGDAELFAIRQAISRELAALKLIDPVDREGVYLKLGALADGVEYLPRRSPESSLENSNQGSSGETARENEGALAKAWREIKLELGQYFKFEDTTKPIKPIVDQHYAQLAGLNIRLLIEQAKLALIKESPVIFQESLREASGLIEDYFPSSPAANEFVTTLNQLSKLQVATDLPDISQSLNLLNGYIRDLHKIQGDTKEAA